MLKVENVDVWGFEHAIRGMRNPMNSWDKSDSGLGCRAKLCIDCPFKKDWCGSKVSYVIGQNDLDLMKRLYKAGTEHRKYLRQIFVSMDIVAPDYFFKEFATYRIGVTENSTSTMHKIAAKEFELDDFSHEHLCEGALIILEKLVHSLNTFREAYLDTSNKEHWWQLIQLLPMSYNYRRTVTMNYENVVTIIRQRTGHKLDEWKTLIDELRKLPYIEEIING